MDVTSSPAAPGLRRQVPKMKSIILQNDCWWDFSDLRRTCLGARIHLQVVYNTLDLASPELYFREMDPTRDPGRVFSILKRMRTLFTIGGKKVIPINNRNRQDL